MLSQKAIEEFKEIHLKETGEELSDADAKKEAIQLLTLFNYIHRPLTNK